MVTQKCEVCGDEGRTETHHTSYFPEETMQVCRECHGVIHDSGGKLSHLQPDNPRPQDYHRYPKDVTSEEIRESDIFHPWNGDGYKRPPESERGLQ